MPNDNPDLANLSDREAPLAPRQAEATPTLADVRDPADDIPVPIVMSPAEIDERAQAVEAVRGTAGQELEPRTDV